MWKYNDKIIREGRSWVDSDGVTHPTSWGRWTDAEKTAAGMVWEDDPAPFDNRFWWMPALPKADDGSIVRLMRMAIRCWMKMVSRL